MMRWLALALLSGCYNATDPAVRDEAIAAAIVTSTAAVAGGASSNHPPPSNDHVEHGANAEKPAGAAHTAPARYRPTPRENRIIHCGDAHFIALDCTPTEACYYVRDDGRSSLCYERPCADHIPPDLAAWCARP